MSLYVLILENSVEGVFSSLSKVMMNRASLAKKHRKHLTDFRIAKFTLDEPGEGYTSILN